jgi:exosome complex component RRP40
MDAEEEAPFTEVIVLPGDDVTRHLQRARPAGAAPAAPIRLGAGLLQAPASGAVHATLPGLLCHLPPQRYFVLASHRRYSPAIGDTVVGIVRERAGEHYRVRLHGTALAQLPLLAFDGATRRNKPSLGLGALVFCRVAACSAHMEPELTCCAPAGAPGGRKDWVTGQGVFGELRGGRLVHVSTGLARRLLDPGCALLAAFARHFAFEAAVGVNGLVWVGGGGEGGAAAGGAAAACVSALVRGIEGAEGASDAECVALAEQCAREALAAVAAAAR